MSVRGPGEPRGDLFFVSLRRMYDRTPKCDRRIG